MVRWLNSGPEGGRRENDNVVLRSIMGVVTEYQCVHAAFSIVYIYPSVLQDVRRSGGEWGEFPFQKPYEKVSKAGQSPHHEATHGSIYERFAART